MLSVVKEYHTVDKSSWGDGLWRDEPDKVQAVDTETGYDVLLVRHPSMGQWCGYVGVPESHPMYGKSYDDVRVSVHGGLTFSATCYEGDESAEEIEATRICHIPVAGSPDVVWWFGFDCAHYRDLSPGMEATLAGLPGHDRVLELRAGLTNIYRERQYVEAECLSLAAQLKALEES